MSLHPARTTLFDDLFSQLASGFTIKPLHGDPLPPEIKLDVKETPEAYTVLAELPGVRKEDIHLELHGRVITLGAEVRQHDSQEQEERLLRSERYYGNVSRSLELPMDVRLDAVTARFDNGLLTLVLPKQAEAKGGQRIAIE